MSNQNLAMSNMHYLKKCILFISKIFTNTKEHGKLTFTNLVLSSVLHSSIIIFLGNCFCVSDFATKIDDINKRCKVDSGEHKEQLESRTG